MTQEEIIEGLLRHDHIHDSAITHLYKDKTYVEPIVKMLKSNKLSSDDVKIIWTDTVVRFASLVRDGKYMHQGNITGYLYNLSRYIMLNYLKVQKRKNSESHSIEDYDIGEEGEIEYGIYNVELKQLLSVELSKLGKNCRDILTLWSRSFSMREIKDKLNIISEQALRKRKHICLKKLLLNINKDESQKMILKSYLENT